MEYGVVDVLLGGGCTSHPHPRVPLWLRPEIGFFSLRPLNDQSRLLCGWRVISLAKSQPIIDVNPAHKCLLATLNQASDCAWKDDSASVQN